MIIVLVGIDNLHLINLDQMINSIVRCLAFFNSEFSMVCFQLRAVLSAKYWKKPSKLLFLLFFRKRVHMPWCYSCMENQGRPAGGRGSNCLYSGLGMDHNIVYTLRLKKKRHPFSICHNLVRCHPIYPILGRNIPHEICNKHSCTAHHTSFHMFVLYLVKSSNDFYGIQ